MICVTFSELLFLLYSFSRLLKCQSKIFSFCVVFFFFYSKSIRKKSKNNLNSLLVFSLFFVTNEYYLEEKTFKILRI